MFMNITLMIQTFELTVHKGEIGKFGITVEISTLITQ
jgi:hypothetical protein